MSLDNRSRPWLKPAFRWIALGLLSYAIFLGAFMLFENKLIFFPARYPAGNWKPAGLDVEDAWFFTEDGTRLHGWLVEQSRPKAVVLIAHGNGGNLSGRADLLRELHRMQCSSLIFDYRGYGRSEGSPSGENIVSDARVARAWLCARANVLPETIVLYGESLGGAVAVELAAKDGARGLILENTFSSLADVGAHHYPWLPVRLLVRTKLDSADAIKSYHGPLLQTHGDRDTVVPYELGHRLFDAANEPKELVTIRGGGHDRMSSEFLAALERFLNRL